MGGVLKFLGRIPTPPECERSLVMPGGGVFDLAPGQFTDEAEMTETLLKMLAKSNCRYTLSIVAVAYNEWAMLAYPKRSNRCTRKRPCSCAWCVVRHSLNYVS
jgi:hypothetical protein